MKNISPALIVFLSCIIVFLTYKINVLNFTKSQAESIGLGNLISTKNIIL